MEIYPKLLIDGESVSKEAFDKETHFNILVYGQSQTKMIYDGKEKCLIMNLIPFEKWTKKPKDLIRSLPLPKTT